MIIKKEIILFFAFILLLPTIYALDDIFVSQDWLPWSSNFSINITHNGTSINGTVLLSGPSGVFTTGPTSFFDSNFSNVSVLTFFVFAPNSTVIGNYPQIMFFNMTSCYNYTVVVNLTIPGNCTNATNETCVNDSYFLINSSNINCSVSSWTQNFTLVIDQPVQPLKVLSVKPNYFEAGFETQQIDVYLGNPRDYAFYAIASKYPDSNFTAWTAMNKLNNRAFVSIDFGREPVGTLFIKLVDTTGNYSIVPTGIVSKSDLKVVLSKNQKLVNPGDSITIPFSVYRKSGSLQFLRVRFDDFLSEDYSERIPAAEHIFLNLANQSIPINTTYSQSIYLGSNLNYSAFLNIQVPPTTSYKRFITKYYFGLFNR